MRLYLPLVILFIEILYRIIRVFLSYPYKPISYGTVDTIFDIAIAAIFTLISAILILSLKKRNYKLYNTTMYVSLVFIFLFGLSFLFFWIDLILFMIVFYIASRKLKTIITVQ